MVSVMTSLLHAHRMMQLNSEARSARAGKKKEAVGLGSVSPSSVAVVRKEVGRTEHIAHAEGSLLSQGTVVP